MNCHETQEILHGYLDGELDLVRSLAVEQHLKECANCSRSYAELHSLHRALAGNAPYFHAPKTLPERVQRALCQFKPQGVPARQKQVPWTWPWRNWLVPLAATALLVFVALPLLSGRSRQNTLAEEILSAHVRSLMVDHKPDVASSDQHTVKPWFEGKLDFAPPVTDLAERGVPLVGGRLDYVQGRPVAALVYQHRKHYINLFIWPEAGQSRSLSARTLQGYNLIRWTASGMSFWAVSDLNRPELETFAQLVK